MQEVGIDISHKSTQSVFELFKAGKLFSYVITVCDKEAAERCPIFPGMLKRFHWSFPDPSTVTGTQEEKLEKVRAIRDLIKTALEQWSKEV
jgi:arsenate reductase